MEGIAFVYHPIIQENCHCDFSEGKELFLNLKDAVGRFHNDPTSDCSVSLKTRGLMKKILIISNSFYHSILTSSV